MFRTEKRDLTSAVHDLKLEIAELRIEREARREERDLHAEALKLREDVERLRIEKGRKVEEHEREKREVKHMVGLERRRQEFEVEAAKREVVVTVREENLQQDRERFEKQMEFTRGRFEAEVGYLRELMEQILLRLPTVTVDKMIETNGHKREPAKAGRSRGRSSDD